MKRGLFGRRGEVKDNAGSASALIALIAFLIVIYIILLPPDVREELLNGNDSGNGNGSNTNDLARILVEENTGTLQKLSYDSFDHNIASINLYTTTSASKLYEHDSILVRNSMFDTTSKTLEFELNDLDNVDNAVLSFVNKKNDGVLTIKLNGKELVSGELQTYPNPIKLDKRNLNENNVLEFSVDGVGWQFWRSNEYLIENIMITADTTDTSKQGSFSTFTVTEEEFENLKSVNLKFFPDCRIADVGKLDIMLNNQKIYSSVPDCGTLNKLELDPNFLIMGSDTLEFSADMGYYLIDQITLNTKLKEPTYPLYYFEINDDDMDEINNNNLLVNMTFRFADDSELKSATIYINGHRLSLNTRDSNYDRDITQYIERGNNALKIEPEKNQLDVISFKLILQEVD